jgi:hypothetical protein
VWLCACVCLCVSVCALGPVQQQRLLSSRAVAPWPLPGHPTVPTPWSPLPLLAAPSVYPDGDMDIVVAAPLSGAVTLLENNGQQVFTARLLANITGSATVTAVDMDKDGGCHCMEWPCHCMVWYSVLRRRGVGATRYPWGLVG